MENGLQCVAFAAVGKDELAQGGAIKLASISHYLSAKGLDDLSQRWLARLHHLAGDEVGIDNRHAKSGKVPCRRTFATTDAAGKANDEHLIDHKPLTLR